MSNAYPIQYPEDSHMLSTSRSNRLRRRLRNYEWSISWGTFIGLLLALGILIATGEAGVDFWLLELNLQRTTFLETLSAAVLTLLITANIVSSSSYLGEAGDRLFKYKTLFNKHRRITKWENDRLHNFRFQFNGTLLGLLFGLVSSIVLVATIGAVPYAALLPGFAAILFVFNTLGSHAGIGSRLGQAYSQFRLSRHSPTQNIRNYDWSIFIALIIGILLCAFLGASVFAPLLPTALPLWFVCIGLISSFVSGASCIGSAVDLFTLHRYGQGRTFVDLFDIFCVNLHNAAVYLNLRHDSLIQTKTSTLALTDKFFYQRRLTYAGIILATLLGITATVLAGPIVLPLASSFGLAMVGIIFCVTLIGSIGGLFNRLGRTLDYATEITSHHTQQESARTIPPDHSSSVHSKTKKNNPTPTPAAAPSATTTPLPKMYDVRKRHYFSTPTPHTPTPIRTPRR